MPPTERWPGVPTIPAASASFANFFSLASSPRGYAEDDVHLRARGFLDRAVVVAAAAVDGVVEQLGFGFVALFDAGDAAFGGDPIHHQADHVDREGGRRVVEGLFFDVRAVLEKRREIFVGALGEILADDDDSGAAGTEIFLRAGEDDAEFFHVDRTRGDVGRHVGNERGVAWFPEPM